MSLHPHPLEIIALERRVQPLPVHGFSFPPGTTYNLVAYDSTSRAQLHRRVRNAHVIIATTVKLDAEALHPDTTPRLKYIAVPATGTDHVDLDVCRLRGIRVTNCPAASLDTVSEHALSLYFAARRRTVLLDRITRAEPSEWQRKGSVNSYMTLPDGKPPLSCKDETLGVIGYGGLGKRIADLGRALGMHVIIAARKAPSASALPDTLPPADLADKRIPFDQVLREATVLVLSLPRNPQTLNLISSAEFTDINPYAVLINISRGGIVDEHAVVEALRQRKFAGYATDVFDTEPIGGPQDSPLLAHDAQDLNITVSPHLAWFSQRTLKNLGDILKETVEKWAKGEEINVVV
ncbi:hypothetical protein ACN47E_006557 [Coniothyrium glycines]